MLCSLSATNSVACLPACAPVKRAQNAFVRIRTQERFHQRSEAGLLRFFLFFHIKGFIHFWQQRAPFTVRQEAVVANHFKMPRRNVADIASDHLFLSELLPLVLLRAVVVMVVYYRATTVMSQLRGGYWGTFQIAANVFDVTPGSPGLFGEMDFPVTLVLSFQVTPPLFIVPDMTKTRQAAGVYAVIASAQQPGDGNTPDMLHMFLFEEQGPPDTELQAQTTTGDGQVDVGMLPELAAISVQGAENTNFDTHFRAKRSMDRVALRKR